MRSALVIGAGPAGCAAALTLARAQIEVTILDAGAQAPFAIGEALPPAARPLLASLGLDGCVTPQHHRIAVGNRSAWDSETLASTDFIMHPFGHGWHLDRRRFDADLLDAARASGATIVRGTFREGIRDGDAWQVRHAHDGVLATIGADAVIDCSGRRAAFARRQGAKRIRYDRLVACAALLRSPTPELDRDATTLIESERDGWWYTAPLPGGKRIVMFASDGDLPAARARRDIVAFRAALAATRHVGALCAAAKYEVTAPIVVTPAETGRLDRCHGDGWLAAGDAAASFDPISSQGIMTALQCGRDAAQAVIDGDAPRYASGIAALFARYAAMRAEAYAPLRGLFAGDFWLRVRGLEAAVGREVDVAASALQKRQPDEA